MRRAALEALPGLAPLTLAALTPPHWDVCYHDPRHVDDALVERRVAEETAAE